MLSEVGQRLADTDGVQRVPTPKAEIFVIRDFLDGEECAEICALIDEKRRPSTIANDSGDALYRTSETCDLDESNALVATVNRRLSDLLGIDDVKGEEIQGQRYAPGQEFKPHTDTFNPGSADYYVHTADKGQRTFTAMLFLNEPEAGGATRFKTLNKAIQPETGKLLVWNNLKADGQPNEFTLHQGMKVRKGTKYIITKWYREARGR
ncbi:prolyl hydroxylase family protein [Sphingomicrobium sediminis]|uniref:2OG-Fe(II) oxygenase n=1 Tax=Sphingomicrobium sediminis TaxID=2950949 RepID=A0A9X2J465_9SPHN|nr:2OG-Fe(II) oxygenase [Sphingomicrobium sediminis]MCM8558041.1 2OG-Fe(II) oxygenase [Sphingomicrobium sediminis]